MMTSKKKTILPDELSIVIHTSVPSVRKFHYNPKMSIINNTSLIERETIFFNSYYKFSTNALDYTSDFEERVSRLLKYDYDFNETKLSENANKVEVDADIIKCNVDFILNTIFETGRRIKINGAVYFITMYEIAYKKVKPVMKKKYRDYPNRRGEEENTSHLKSIDISDFTNNIDLESNFKSMGDNFRQLYSNLKRGQNGGSNFEKSDDRFTVNLSSNDLLLDIASVISNIINIHNNNYYNMSERVTYALYNNINGVVLGNNNNFTKKSIRRIIDRNIEDYNDLYEFIDLNKISTEEGIILQCLKWIVIINEKLQIDLHIAYDNHKKLLYFENSLEKKIQIQNGGDGDDSKKNVNKDNIKKDEEKQNDDIFRTAVMKKLFDRSNDYDDKRESKYKYEIEIFLGLSTVNDGIYCKNKMHKLRYSFNKFFGRDNIKTNKLYNKGLKG